MDSVEPGNTIFMFAKGVGIIGVGVAEGTAKRLMLQRLIAFQSISIQSNGGFQLDG
jgi:hypothetical protein